MVIFHSYVSLPEGMYAYITEIWFYNDIYIYMWLYGFRYSLMVCILNIVTIYIYIVVISISSAILY